MAIVSLSMYDLPEMRPLVDAFWSALSGAMRRAGIEEVPERLDRETPLMDQWLDPGLLLSQTCGYPLTHALKNQVSLVATPLYDCPDVAGSHYCSLIVVRADDPAESLQAFRGRGAVINGWDSQSGYSVLRHAVASLPEQAPERGPFFSALGVSGGHLASLDWVRAGQADVCAVDCVTYHLAARFVPAALEGLRVLDRTASAPSLPFITRLDPAGALVARLRVALEEVMGDPLLTDLRGDLMLGGVEILPISAYDRILEIEMAACRLGGLGGESEALR